MASSLPARSEPPPSGEIDVAALYDAHADFVWRSLYRLGVRSADVPDLLQEVFVLVHQRRAELTDDAARGLLWTVAVGLVRNYRRRAHRRLEQLGGRLPDRAHEQDPERVLDARANRLRGQRLLAALDPEKRAVFAMFEVEGLSGRAIAEQLGLPIGTVHSRLHAARRELARGLERDDE